MFFFFQPCLLFSQGLGYVLNWESENTDWKWILPNHTGGYRLARHGRKRCSTNHTKKVWSIHFICNQSWHELGDSWNSAVFYWCTSCISIKLATDSEKCHAFSTRCDHEHLLFSLVGTTLLWHSCR